LDEDFQPFTTNDLVRILEVIHAFTGVAALKRRWAQRG
jgi:hypothetical protein